MIILYLKKNLYSKLNKGDTIILKKEMMEEKPNTFETEIPYSKKIESAFKKNKGFRYRKMIGGSIEFNINSSDSDSDASGSRMARPNKFKLQGGSLVGDVARDVVHQVVHTVAPKVGALMGAAGSSMLGMPEFAGLAAKGGEYLGQQAANGFTSVTGVGIKDRHMGLKRVGKRSFLILHKK